MVSEVLKQYMQIKDLSVDKDGDGESNGDAKSEIVAFLQTLVVGSTSDSVHQHCHEEQDDRVKCPECNALNEEKLAEEFVARTSLVQDRVSGGVSVTDILFEDTDSQNGQRCKRYIVQSNKDLIVERLLH